MMAAWRAPLLLICVLSFSDALCPPLKDSTGKFKIECSANGHSIPCDADNVPQGTVATYKCQDFYEAIGTANRRVCKQSGSWTDLDLFFCSLECGRKESPSTTQIYFGQPATRGQWPWHAALYIRKGDRWELSCGGTLVDDRFIITASHCLAPERERTPYDRRSFKVVMGKYHSDYDQKDEGEQEFGVKELHMHSRYSPTPIENDIAILVLDSPVKITLDVRPACLPINWKIANFHLEPDRLGTIPGWGLTEERMKSDILQVANLPFVSLSNCLGRLPQDLRSSVGQDVFCASFFNGTGTCRGDSGGGLVFPYGVPIDHRWYLQGVVSWGINLSGAENPKPCDPILTFFTKVFEFIQWINEIMQNAAENRKAYKFACKVPTEPQTSPPNIPTAATQSPGPLPSDSNWDGTCRNDACCKGLQVPNNTTGSGFTEYMERCLQGGLHCVGNSGCAVCWCFRPKGINEGNRPRCILPC